MQAVTRSRKIVRFLAACCVTDFSLRIPTQFRDAASSKHRITDAYGNSGLALQKPGFRLRTGDTRQKVADAYDRAERVQMNSYKLHDGEYLCPDCTGLGEDDDGYPCETCNGSGVMPAVEDDKGKDKRGTPKHFGSGNHSTDRRMLDQMTHDHRANMARLYSQLDFELSQQWRG